MLFDDSIYRINVMDVVDVVFYLTSQLILEAVHVSTIKSVRVCTVVALNATLQNMASDFINFVDEADEVDVPSIDSGRH